MDIPRHCVNDLLNFLKLNEDFIARNLGGFGKLRKLFFHFFHVWPQEDPNDGTK